MWGVNTRHPIYSALRVQIANIVAEYAHGFALSALRGRGLEFSGLRKFAQGDAPNRVDWKASARLLDDTELLVRTFTPERKPIVIVVADLSRSMESPQSKAFHAHAMVEMYARSAFLLGGTSYVVGVGKNEIIASPELDSADDVLMFMNECDHPLRREQFAQPHANLGTLFADWKPKNALVVFVSDLREMDSLPLDAVNVIDRVQQNVAFAYIVLDEWSGFVPSNQVVTLQSAEDGSVQHFDLREGGEFHQESLKFSDRVENLRTLGRRKGMSVHLLPLTHERPLATFMRSWHKFQATRT